MAREWGLEAGLLPPFVPLTHVFLRYSYQLRAVRPHPKSGLPVWTNQASICHGSYYFAIPGNLVKVSSQEESWFERVNQDPRLGPTHTTHTDGRELSQDTLDLIRGVQWQVWKHSMKNVKQNQAHQRLPGTYNKQ